MLPHLDPSGNFLGIAEEYSTPDRSAIAILSAPYEHTVSYGAGTANGPSAILEASQYVEFWDEEYGRELCFDVGIATFAAIDFKGKTDRAALDVIQEHVRELLEMGKFTVTLGGEHTISAAPIRAHLARWPNMSVLHFDAHSDLRDSYEGSPYSHASVMARVLEDLPPERLVQVGIRAQCREEAERIAADGIHTFYARDIRSGRFGMSWKERVLDALVDDVYISFDIDYFDPSIMPATGTPEPGGGLWDETMDLLAMVGKKKRIIGFDVVELAPAKEHPFSSFLGARLVYRMLNAAFQRGVPSP